MDRSSLRIRLGIGPTKTSDGAPHPMHGTETTCEKRRETIAKRARGIVEIGTSFGRVGDGNDTYENSS